MNQNQDIHASILDRLIDEQPGISREPVRHRVLSINQIKASVIRDLENLLNARRQITPVPAEYREVSNSLFVYGLRDFTSEDPRSPSIKQQLRNDVEKTISRFDSRLRHVMVRLEASAQNERNVRFRISGLLVVDPVSEPGTFYTFFYIKRGED